MHDLLTQTRRVNTLLQEKGFGSINYSRMVSVISEVTAANCYLADQHGTILGAAASDFSCEEGISASWGRLPASFNAMLMQERSSCVKVYRDNNCIFQPQATCSLSYRSLVIAPVLSGVRRLGTLLLVKYSTAQNEEDMILGEYSAAVIGMEIVYNQSDLVEEEIRKKAAVEHAFQCLSHSENEAVQYILNQLQDGEGVFVAARVANRIGYTQSVIVNALRKLESAGVLEARSLGVKGTYIRILNKYLSGKLQGVRKPVS